MTYPLLDALREALSVAAETDPRELSAEELTMLDQLDQAFQARLTALQKPESAQGVGGLFAARGKSAATPRSRRIRLRPPGANGCRA